MSILKRLSKSFQILLRELLLLPAKFARWLKRKVFASVRGASRSSQAGFILPTVVMVILVVTLLTTTIVFRSFDRAKNASNVRVNQVTLNAALPAIERAKQKLDAAFSDPTLPRGTPADGAINTVLVKPKYTLGDEVRLQLAVDFRNAGYDMSSDNNIQPDENQGIELSEVMQTAWRYPIDTDGNGKFDSFTLYGIYFRSPNRATSGADVGAYARERIPLDARTPPQDDGSTSNTCAAALGTSASLVDAQGWFKSGDKLKKSFYVYTTTIPIVDRNADNVLPQGANADDYENYVGNRGFTALEYQQDRARIPLGNNAIVYEDDLDLLTGPAFRINGRIIVNSNLLAAESSNGVFFYQVSSAESCFYEAENAKIIIGGNVINSNLGTNSTGSLDVDLYKGKGVVTGVQGATNIGNTRQSTSNAAIAAAYNTQAYEERIEQLVQEARIVNPLPEAVRDEIGSLTSGTNPISNDEATQKALEVWFRNRTRRVPFAEVPFGDAGVLDPNGDHLEGEGSDLLRPIAAWHFPDNGNTNLTVLDDKLPATDPNVLQEVEERLGDRVLVGNNLPAVWYNGSTNSFADENTPNTDNPFIGLGTGWTNAPGGSRRYRLTRVQQLVDLGLTERDGFWETAAAELPKNPLDGVGGLRVVTGAGVYLPQNSGDGIFNKINGCTDPNNCVSRVVWPDSMPMIPQASDPTAAPTPTPEWMSVEDLNGNGTPDALEDDNGLPRPFLKMRASVVYHYTHDSNAQASDPSSPPDPIACVSSYYDPTDFNTARNRVGLSDVSGILAWEGSPVAVPPVIDNNRRQSNNGITYVPPTEDGLNVASNDAQLAFQAGLVYPNGRLVNPRLAKALATGVNDRTLADRAAIDSTLCALQILGIRGVIGRSTLPSGYSLPDGTIQEISFLDARELKAIEGNLYNRGDTLDNAPHNDNSNDYDVQPENSGRSDAAIFTNASERISEYDLSVELRQPLEIRATVLDLDTLRNASALPLATPSHTGPETEWMLPDSGIIYATRDDALPDISNKPGNPNSNPNLIAPSTLYENELASDKLSASDFWLDPTRRPGGILLINGSRLNRNNRTDFTGEQNQLEEEKGLILASNLPVYIKAQTKDNRFGFNLHDHEEFNTPLDDEYINFYTRPDTDFDTDFACRRGDNRLPTGACPNGDNWRPVAVLGDSLTLLSDTFRFGFRNDGDYDLRNNQTDNLFRSIATADFPNTNIPLPRGSLRQADIVTPTEDMVTPANVVARSTIDKIVDKRRRNNGFWDNTFITNGLSSRNDKNAFGVGLGVFYTDVTYSDNTPVNQVLNSSYFNNYVTPIQRRDREGAPEYLMEMCRKLPVSECKPSDWVVGYSLDPNDSSLSEQINEANSFGPPIDINGDGDTTDTFFENEITSEQLLRIIGQGVTVNYTRLGAGTTELQPFDPLDQHYARRIAFKRNYGNLEFVDVGTDGANRVPIPLGIDTSPTPRVTSFEYKPSVNAVGTNPRPDPRPGSGNAIAEFTVDGFVAYDSRPRNAPSNNALWFRGSDNRAGELWDFQANDDFTEVNRWLSYEQPDDIDLTRNDRSRRNAYKVGFFDERDDWKLPDISTSADNIQRIGQIRGALSQLNGFDVEVATPVLDDGNPVDYSLCIQGQRSKNARFMSDPGFRIQASNCPRLAQIDNAVGDFRNLAGNVYQIPVIGADPIETTEMLALPRIGENPLVADTSVYVYEFNTADIFEQTPASNRTFNFIGSNEPTNNPASLTLNGDQDTIFVFRAQAGNLNQPLLFQNFNLVLNGVNPNNVFWISEGGVTFAGNNRLAGNFLSTNLPANLLRFDSKGAYEIPNRDPLDSANPLYVNSNTVINGGRFLGFGGTGDSNYSSIDEAIDIAAAAPAELTFKGISTSHQPLVVPVLQLSQPQDETRPTNIRTESKWLHHWLPVPADTTADRDRGTFNLVMAVGDTPNRYRANPLVQENNGGLGNFPRFLERWQDTSPEPDPVIIRGSFIQLQRSAYSTGPFRQLLSDPNDRDGEIRQNNRGSFFEYAQRYSNNGTRNHTYRAPKRLWGFDVGVLSQLPDLFSQRFTLPPTDDPNEYYREVSRDDDWIRTLLCAVQMPKVNAGGSIAENVDTNLRAVNLDQRPNDYCQGVSRLP